MENKKDNLKRIFVFCVILIIIYWGINNMNLIGNIINKIISIIFPFILGGALAFILNIPMTFF